MRKYVFLVSELGKSIQKLIVLRQNYHHRKDLWQIISIAYFEEVYFPAKIIHTKTPSPDMNFALCLTPFGMNTVDGDDTLYTSSSS